jgi:hypothetical protein
MNQRMIKAELTIGKTGHAGYPPPAYRLNDVRDLRVTVVIYGLGGLLIEYVMSRYGYFLMWNMKLHPNMG